MIKLFQPGVFTVFFKFFQVEKKILPANLIIFISSIHHINSMIFFIN